MSQKKKKEKKKKSQFEEMTEFLDAGEELLVW